MNYAESYAFISQFDPEIGQAMALELGRQRDHIELIASENFVSPAVLAAMGSPLTNKYAEGYPGKRYYGGCEYVDMVETIAIDRAKKLFGAEHANVQPHAGAQANLAAYQALIQPGDTVLAMNLNHGGHLTHGHKVNESGRLYHFVQYGVREDTGYIDYEELERLAHEHMPKLIVAGASAYSRIIDFERFGKIAKDVGAYFMVDMAHISGLIATGEHPNPFPYADIVTSHHAQDPARRAWRSDPLQGGVCGKGGQSGVSGHAGRSLDACHRGQGDLFPGGDAACVQNLSTSGCVECGGARTDIAGQRA